MVLKFTSSSMDSLRIFDLCAVKRYCLSLFSVS